MDRIKEYITNQFTQQVGYIPNIDNPKTFNEKIQWLKLYYHDPLMTKCADKYAVREYIKEKIGEKYLIPLLGAYDTPEQINFDKLPNKFVLKINNGSGKNIICRNKKSLDIEETKKKLSEWLKPENSHYFYSYEWAYKDIKPKIICEKYIEEDNHKLKDYRFLCFHGKPQYIWVDTNSLNNNPNHKRNTFDIKWNEINAEIGHPRNLTKIQKPKKLNELINIATKLSKDFPHVRVDLYLVKNIIYFGELCFYSQNGMANIKPVEWDYKIGKYLSIRKIKNKNILDYLNYKKTRKAKVVIYTANSENYDKLINHTYLSKDFNYVCFTDKKIKNPGVWEIRPIKKTKLDSVRTSKYYKLFPHEVLPNYKYSVWIDTNVDVTSNILEKRVNELIKKKIKIAIPPHFERNCIYQEAKACIVFQKDNPDIILKQINFLKKEKYPKNNGLFENNLIFRDHNDSKIIKVMEDWWWMISNFSRRDQLSLNYVLWKNKTKCEKLFSQNARFMNDDFIFNEHNTKIVSTLFIDNKNGFNNNDFIQKLVTVSNNKFKIKFDLKEFTEVKQINFNPLRNQFCQVKINKIKINTKSIPDSDFKYQTNGEILESGFIDFKKTSDPQIIFKIPQNTKILSIYGDINLYNTETLYNETNREKDQLQADLIKTNREKDQLQADLIKTNREKDQLQSKLNIIKNINQQKKMENKINNKINLENQKIYDLEQTLKEIRSIKAFKLWRIYCKITGK
ncbi:MAG: ATP-grasp fold amidoligase family protein [Candidatus Shapirobacteria bacterium]